MPIVKCIMKPYITELASYRKSHTLRSHVTWILSREIQCHVNSQPIVVPHSSLVGFASHCSVLPYTNADFQQVK